MFVSCLQGSFFFKESVISLTQGSLRAGFICSITYWLTDKVVVMNWRFWFYTLNRYGDSLAVVCCNSRCCHGDHRLSGWDGADQRWLGHFDRLSGLRGCVSIDKEATTGCASRGRAIAVMERRRGRRNSWRRKRNGILKYESFGLFQWMFIEIIMCSVMVLVSFKASHLFLQFYCWTQSCWECVWFFLNRPPGVEEALPAIYIWLFISAILISCAL